MSKGSSWSRTTLTRAQRPLRMDDIPVWYNDQGGIRNTGARIEWCCGRLKEAQFVGLEELERGAVLLLALAVQQHAMI